MMKVVHCFKNGIIEDSLKNIVITSDEDISNEFFYEAVKLIMEGIKEFSNEKREEFYRRVKEEIGEEIVLLFLKDE